MRRLPPRASITRQFGGEVEKFIGDGVVVSFNSRGDQPDHALRAARAALALQRRFGELTKQHPGWPRMRSGLRVKGKEASVDAYVLLALP